MRDVPLREAALKIRAQRCISIRAGVCGTSISPRLAAKISDSLAGVIAGFGSEKNFGLVSGGSGDVGSDVGGKFFAQV